jgi:hypothetical protein
MINQVFLVVVQSYALLHFSNVLPARTTCTSTRLHRPSSQNSKVITLSRRGSHRTCSGSTQILSLDPFPLIHRWEDNPPFSLPIYYRLSIITPLISTPPCKSHVRGLASCAIQLHSLRLKPALLNRRSAIH